MANFVAERELHGPRQPSCAVLGGRKNEPIPLGLARTHRLEEEAAFDFAKHLGRLKAKDDESQPYYLVKLWATATSSDAKAGTSRMPKPFVFLIASEIEVPPCRRTGPPRRPGPAGNRPRAGAVRPAGPSDGQLDKLAQPNADRALIGRRLSEAHRFWSSRRVWRAASAKPMRPSSASLRRIESATNPHWSASRKSS